MIKIFDNFEIYSDEEYEKILSSFPKCLKEKVEMRNGKDRKKMCIFEYFQVQKLLKLKNLNDLRFSENGKPYIKNQKYFNISNSENFVCIAISDKPVGVDIQKKIPFEIKLAKKICSDKEFEKIERSQDKDLEITKLWAMKESVVKCEGQRIFQDLRKIEKDQTKYKFTTKTFDNLCVCQCEKRQ